MGQTPLISNFVGTQDRGGHTREWCWSKSSRNDGGVVCTPRQTLFHRNRQQYIRGYLRILWWPLRPLLLCFLALRPFPFGSEMWFGGSVCASRYHNPPLPIVFAYFWVVYNYEGDPRFFVPPLRVCLSCHRIYIHMYSYIIRIIIYYVCIYLCICICMCMNVWCIYRQPSP